MAHLRSSAWLLCERSLDIAQSEADVFAQPDAWYSTESFLGAYPGLWQIEVPSEFSRGHQVGRRTGLNVLFVRFRCRLDQPARSKNEQKTWNLIEGDPTGPLDDRRIVLVN
jgi:hypothetical protein